MVHELKILPIYFEDVAHQKKTFEIRKNDRNYNVGDTLILKEWNRGKYTGREVKRTVSYIYYGDGTYGLPDGYVVMAIRGARAVLDCAESEEINMGQSILIIDTPKTCGDCHLCIFSADEKRHIGFCNTSDEDYYCKVLDRFMEYDRVDGGIDILGKPTDCPLKKKSEE